MKKRELKQRIAELEERVRQLEAENAMLRTNIYSMVPANEYPKPITNQITFEPEGSLLYLNGETWQRQGEQWFRWCKPGTTSGCSAV